MITDLYQDEFPSIYQQLCELLPDRPWLHRVSRLNFQAKANHLARGHLMEVNRLAYALSSFDEKGITLVNTPLWDHICVAMMFSAQVLDIHSACVTEKDRSSFLGRVCGSFANPDDQRAMTLEHHTALALHRAGAQIEWTDEHAGGSETYDMLAHQSWPEPVEIECKSWGRDKGVQITQTDAVELLNRLVKKVSAYAQPGHAVSIAVTVPGRLPKSLQDLDAMCMAIDEAIISGRPSTGDGVLLKTSLQLLPRELKASSNRPSDQILVEAVERLIGPPLGYRSIGIFSESAVIVEVVSNRPPRKFKAWWGDVKKAVREQMTGDRPGCLVVRLEGVSHAQLEQIRQDPQNALAIFATEVLTHEKHQHLASLVYVSDSMLIRQADSNRVGQSKAYVFSSQGRYADHPIRKVFLQ